MRAMRTLLVTLAIGENYLREYEALFKNSQQAYAETHGYDFKVVTDYLDPEHACPGAISFHKILVCSQEWSQAYDFILFVDADILIHPRSPSLHDFMDYGDKIGVVDEYSQPTKALRLETQRRMNWESTATDYYKLCDFEIETEKVFNSGVLVLQPRKHAAFLENIYRKHVGTAASHRRRFHYEQSAIGYYLQFHDMYKVLPNEFNAVWALTKISTGNSLTLQEFYKKNFFTHFAGHCDIDKVPDLNP
jgi:hypothetical protein